jgi:hypothetical protein
MSVARGAPRSSVFLARYLYAAIARFWIWRARASIGSRRLYRQTI